MSASIPEFFVSDTVSRKFCHGLQNTAWGILGFLGKTSELIANFPRNPAVKFNRLRLLERKQKSFIFP